MVPRPPLLLRGGALLPKRHVLEHQLRVRPSRPQHSPAAVARWGVHSWLTRVPEPPRLRFRSRGSSAPCSAVQLLCAM
ncbi:hypothetical protein NDU88_006529 [Pleurodeles waltl]|uniref:Uncharacterized protein n=1 Tax=Pleurodeles waltl TaxID=8319 RepID=A0AAV7RLQ3_PLEWA|nr:hypothetical protein NDU88_006529 [Pleurodeles waltl]